MADDIEISVTVIENNIEVTTQPTDEVIDIAVTDNADNVTINVTPSIIEINVNKSIPAENNLVTSVNTRVGDVVIVASDVGLGNVDNTGDFDKPISTAAAAEFNVKADLIDGLVPNTQLPVTSLAVMTGLSQGGVLSINTDTAKFDISAGFGRIVNGHTNPDVPTTDRVSFDASEANVIPNLATQEQTFVSIDINGALNFTPNPLTPTERRSFIRLGVIVHLDNTAITFIDNQPTVNIEVGGQVQDLLEAFGFRSLSGNRILPVGANLKIKKELGKLFKSGANFQNLITQPHTFTLPAQDPISFKYRTQTGAEGSTITDINPGIYDVNGTITAMPATATLATIQRVFIFQDGTIRLQLGQRFFNNLNEAVTAINSDVFINDVDISENALYLGAIVMIRGTTALNNLAQAIFVPSNGVGVNGSTSAAPLGYTAEDAANKQNNLNVDGTGAKYPTVDAINLEVVKLTGNQTIAGLKTFSSDISVNGLKVGKGTGNISTNTVFGVGALNNNSTGTGNIAFGESSLLLNQTGFDNIAVGSSAIRNNISGIRNVGIGNGSLLATTGSGNTGIGRNTIASNTTGVNNIAIGNSAGNVIGSGATGATILNSSIFIGNDTRPLLNNQTNQIAIGTSAIGLGSNTSVIGNLSTVFSRIWGRLLFGSSVDDGVNALQITGTAKVSSSLQVGDNTGSASADNQGAIRYRIDSNNSFMEMSMQTGASAYAWVIIKQNTF